LAREELERLRADGHEIRRDGRHYRIAATPESARATQLFRTLLHEIGHWVDYVEKVQNAPEAGKADDALLFFARPLAERESFAHRNAETTRAHLIRFGIIPFHRIVPLGD
jgi:hypothetical protein